MAQLYGRVFFAFLKISATNLRILWRHLPTELRNVYCVVKHIWSSNKQRKFSIIFEIWYLVKRPVSNMIVLPHTKFRINRTVNRWDIAINDFQYGGQPPFWIWKSKDNCCVCEMDRRHFENGFIATSWLRIIWFQWNWMQMQILIPIGLVT